jgi:hypothetical protein
MATLGDSTSKRLAAVVKQANSSPAGPAGLAGAKYYGDAPGGRIGTWGRAPTGRSGSMLPNQPLSDLHKNVMNGSLAGKRERVRPNSEGAKSLWDTLPSKTLPQAPAKGGRPRSPNKLRPQSAHTSRTPLRCAACRSNNCLHLSIPMDQAARVCSGPVAFHLVCLRAPHVGYVSLLRASMAMYEA